MNFKKLVFKQREIFISTINHDLRVPVIAQIRALELLAAGNMGVLNNEQSEIVNLTLASCKSIYGMLSAILSAYKYENRDVILNYETVNILSLIENYFSQNFDKRNIEKINIENKADDVIIRGDKLQLKKAFEYILNYCISCSNGSMHLKIVNDDEFIKIILIFKSMSSNLNDLSPHKMEQVGSSLGMYLAKKIVQAHHGKINVEFDNSKNYYSIEFPLNNVNLCDLNCI